MASPTAGHDRSANRGRTAPGRAGAPAQRSTDRSSGWAGRPCASRRRCPVLDADFRTNVHGTLAVIRAFLPVLERAAGGATIANVLSLTSLASFPALGGYSASKAAAWSATQALRPALKAKHIELLAVLPGPIDTDMVRALSMPKTSPADTAKGVLAGIARG